MKLYANLHTHSTHSDGKYSPAEMVKVAKDEGYKALAITDHDTATAFPFLKEECDKEGLDCIFGVEFTANSELINSGYFHMVAFDFDPEYPEMKEYLRKLSVNETEQTKYCFDKGQREGGRCEITWESGLSDITWEEVLEYNGAISWLCNEHLFRAMKAKGIVTDLDYEPFFKAYFGPRRYEFQVPYEFLDVKDLIKLVHDAGGIILLAHPHRQLHLIDQLVEWGLDGLEVWHPELDEKERAEAYKIALDKELFVSGGSDHSGLCGGLYDSFEHPEETHYYIEPLSAGNTEMHFKELKERKINKEERAKIIAAL